MFLLQLLLTAMLSSLFTLVLVRWWLKRQGAPLWEKELDELHESIARTVDVRVKRAIIEAMSEVQQNDVGAASRRTPSIISDSLQAVFSRTR
ncbi:MAG: hypothetical protein C0509_05580 [Acinetobacter sp.]|nr:hypothetical protein [Acinetobacter sp.]MDO9621618.1 hypothetical protein [Moraxellaceae bacterium]